MKRLINGVNLNVLEQGSGALTLVFLHYFGGSALEWQAVMNQLADEYKCVAVDLRGCGDSDASESGYSVEDMADDVATLIQDLSIDQFVLVGHSMSGKVAMQLASRRPKGLRQLLLVSPSPPRPEPIPDEDREEMRKTHGQRAAAEKTFEKITVRPVSNDVKDQIIADNLRTSAPAWNAWLTLGSKEDIADQMVSVDVPVAIIVGSDDKALAPEVQQELTIPYLKNVTIETIGRAGHLLPWETPDELATFIRKKIVS
ncbi:alpha/beta fold hydrolase [Spirosoma pomorum]